MATLGLLILASTSQAQEPEPEPEGPAAGNTKQGWADPFQRGIYLGASSCKRCHTQPIQDDLRRGTLDWCLLTEFSTWRAMDKHSLAYAVLEGPRGQKIGELLGEPGQPLNVAESRECLSCHALDVPADRIDAAFSKTDGVNCELCHGPSGEPGGWSGPHAQATWRDRTPQEKAEFNFVDLRVPETKVRLCMSCHVGDASMGRIVTHPMYAAGHPPLPSIDVASFVKNEPQHWRDQDNVPYWEDAPQDVRDALGIREGKLYQAEVSITSGILSLSEAMKFLGARSNISKVEPDQLKIWPELTLNPRLQGDERLNQPDQLPGLLRSRWPEVAMTHLDCTGCHHDLRLPGWRPLRGYRITPGRPIPRNWSNPVIELAIELYGDADDQFDFQLHLESLYQAFDAQPFGAPDLVNTAAKDLQSWADGFYRKIQEGASFDQTEGPRMLAGLSRIALQEIPDYDTARQIAAAISVIYRDWAVQVGELPANHDQIRKILDHWEATLNLGRYPYSQERDQLSLQVLEELRDSELNIEDFGSWIPKVLGPTATPEEFFQASRDSPIITAIFGIDSEELRKAYVTDQFKAELQRINNRGIQESLKISAAYDPFAFQQEVQRLQTLLSGS